MESKGTAASQVSASFQYPALSEVRHLLARKGSCLEVGLGVGVGP